MTPSTKLRELADFIETKAERFDYGDWTKRHTCGTKHCAGGWAVELWPEQLRFDEDGYPTLIEQPLLNPCAAIAKVIGCSEEVADSVFIPAFDSALLRGEDAPSCSASASEVATWLRRHADALEVRA